MKKLLLILVLFSFIHGHSQSQQNFDYIIYPIQSPSLYEINDVSDLNSSVGLYSISSDLLRGIITKQHSRVVRIKFTDDLQFDLSPDTIEYFTFNKTASNSLLKGDIFRSNSLSKVGSVLFSISPSGSLIGKFIINDQTLYLVPDGNSGFHKFLSNDKVDNDFLIDIALPIAPKSNFNRNIPSSINNPYPDDKSIIDVLIVFTSVSSAWADDMFGDEGAFHVANLSMDLAQQTVDNSLVNIQYNYDVEFIDFDERIYNSYYLLSALSFPDPNFIRPLDYPNYYRYLHNSDLVALFVVVNDVGGIAWLPGEPNSGYGYSLTRIQQAYNSYTHPHELGHNFGNHHSRLQDSNAAPESGGREVYSTGWRFSGNTIDTSTNEPSIYTTVMSYAGYQGKGSTRIPYYSNPDVNYDGNSTGISEVGAGGPADNARSMNEVRNAIADYVDFNINYEVPFLKSIESYEGGLITKELELDDILELDLSIHNAGNTTLNSEFVLGYGFNREITSSSEFEILTDQLTGDNLFALSFSLTNEFSSLLIDDFALILSETNDFSGDLVQFGGQTPYKNGIRIIPLQSTEDSINSFFSRNSLNNYGLNWVPKAIAWFSPNNSSNYVWKPNINLYGVGTPDLEERIISARNLSIPPETKSDFRLTIQPTDGFNPEVVDGNITILSNDFIKPVITIPFEIILREPLAEEVRKIYPENDISVNPSELSFLWENSANSKSYRIELFENGTPLIFEELTDTIYVTDKLRPLKEYTWNVVGINSSGDGNIANSYSFKTTDIVPDIPIIKLPINGDSLINSNVLLDWNRVSKANKYLIEISKDNFESIYRSYNSSTSAFRVELPFHNTYWWRVKAYNDDLEGEYSEISMFYLYPKPLTQPEIIIPTDGDSIFIDGLENYLNFKWNRVSGALKYHFKGYNSDSTQVFIDTLINGTSLSIMPESFDFKNARVRALNNDTISEWSSNKPFTLNLIPLESPQIKAPQNHDKISNPKNVKFDWTKVSKAEEYQFNLFLRDSLISSDTISNSFIRKDLSYGDSYMWYVEAANKYQIGPRSEETYFSTDSYMLDPKAINLEVFDASCNNSNDGKFKIKANDKSIEYEVFLNGDFISTLNESNYFSYEINNLSPGSYQICFKIRGISNYQRCYSSEIKTPGELSVEIENIDSKTIRLYLTGLSSYNIRLNDTMFSTSKSIIDLELNEGQNSIQITGISECSGEFTKLITTKSLYRLFPNPFKDFIQILLPEKDEDYEVSVYNIEGEVIYQNIYRDLKNEVIYINTQKWNSGIHFFRIKPLNNSDYEKITTFRL